MSEKLVARFHEKAAAYSSVTNRLGRLDFSEDGLEPGIQPGKPSDGFIDFKIPAELTAFPFHWAETRATTIKIPPPTMWDHPRKRAFTVKTLR
jgi:hypothetical protein